MAPKKVRVGVVGVGGIAVAQHIPGWRTIPGAEIVAAADVDADRLARVCEEHKIPHACRRASDLFAMDEIDIVDVCTPNTFHARLAVAALNAGKHVVVEKPMCTSTRDADRMIAASKQANKKLMCAQHQRFLPVSQALKAYLGTGAAGDLYFARAQALRRRLVPARPGFIDKKLSGGGPMYDIGVHILDLTWWLMGCPKPLTVSGETTARLAHREDIRGEWGEWDRKRYNVEDFAVALIRCEAGAVISLETSFLLNMKERSIFATQICGTHAGVSFPSGEIFTEHSGVTMLSSVVTKPEIKPHHEELRGFHEAVVRDEPVPVPPEQSREVVKMLEAVYRSSRLKREVKLSSGSKHSRGK